MKYEDSWRVLVVNCGSSSLKYKLIDLPRERELVAGEAERVGIATNSSPLIRHRVLNEERTVEADLPDHVAAFRKVLKLISEDTRKNGLINYQAFAHRYVHPGNFFSSTVKVNTGVLLKLRKTWDLAPIHNPISYRLIDLCRKDFPGIPQFAVFDTSFHRTIPRELSTYSLPGRFIRKYGLKRIGFHGISHSYVSREACGFLGRKFSAQKIISCHLGTGGSSVCAVREGRSLDTSMGFTPLEGLVMNTRVGDVDLGAVFYLMSRDNLSARDAEFILNKKSGLLGIVDVSSDLRDIISAGDADAKARVGFSMYIKRVRKYIGFYSLLLKKADLLIFTDSIGINTPLVRDKVCEGLEVFGLRLDKVKNERYSGGIADISGEGSQTRILVVPTNEELMIAREAYRSRNR